jgi:hypothetical protein
MAITNGHSDDSAAFSQLLSAAAEAADVIHSSPMAAAVDHSSVSRGASDAPAAIGGQTHETLRPSDARPRNGQVPGGSVTMVVSPVNVQSRVMGISERSCLACLRDIRRANVSTR